MKQYIILVSILASVMLGVHSCSRPEGQSVITGNFPSQVGNVVKITKVLPLESIDIDSTIIKGDGMFEFKVISEKASIYTLSISDAPTLYLSLKPEEDMYIVSETSDLSKVMFKERKDLSDYSKISYDFYSTRVYLDSLLSIVRTDPNSSYLTSMLDNELDLHIERLKKESKQFIDEHSASLMSSLALFQTLGKQKVFNLDSDSIYFSRVDSAFIRNYPTNINTKYLHKKLSFHNRNKLKRLAAQERMKIGKKIPVVSIPDMRKRPYKIGVEKDKKQLLYFWSSSDPLSRSMNKDIVSIYEKDNGELPELVTIAMDERRDLWSNAVVNDKLPGVHLSEMQGMKSIISGIYDIPSKLPYFIQIDKDGTILFKGNHLPTE
ncbi:MAG: TlpA family protein disulfide reductase [Hyphomicrobiales bacterium]